MKCPACLTVTESNLVFSCNYTPTTLDKLKIFDERKILCCPNCNFGMIETDVDEELLQRYYSSEYGGKARKQAETKTNISDLRTSFSIDMRSLSQLALIGQYIDIQSDVTVVEIGPGMGNFLFSLKQMSFEGEHIAFEPQKQAQKFLEKLGSSIEGYNFDMDGAKKFEGSVDLVVMSHSLEHFNPGRVSEIMDAVCLMLKPGGIFFCEIPNADLIKYPNSGEMVVPHLSFFSMDSLKNFITNSKMELKFIGTCGMSQFKKNESKRIDELRQLGHFTYDVDGDDEDILRNRNYHLYLERERLSRGKKQRILNLINNILGSKNLLIMFNWIRRFRQPPISSLIGSKHFSYGNDREFLRFIAKK
jgi:SAM-dependent methyltransferase